MHAVPEVLVYLIMRQQLRDCITDLVELHSSVYQHGQVEAT